MPNRPTITIFRRRFSGVDNYSRLQRCFGRKLRSSRCGVAARPNLVTAISGKPRIFFVRCLIHSIRNVWLVAACITPRLRGFKVYLTSMIGKNSPISLAATRRLCAAERDSIGRSAGPRSAPKQLNDSDALGRNALRSEDSASRLTRRSNDSDALGPNALRSEDSASRLTRRSNDSDALRRNALRSEDSASRLTGIRLIKYSVVSFLKSYCAQRGFRLCRATRGRRRSGGKDEPVRLAGAQNPQREGG
jgi:hypothetical protein